MLNSDDAWRLFTREVALTDEVKRRDSDPTLGLISLLASTTTLSKYPTTASSYYACQPLTLLGTEVEGGPGVVSSTSTTSATFFALNIGSTVPPSGTQIVVTRVDNRWVFRYDSWPRRARRSQPTPGRREPSRPSGGLPRQCDSSQLNLGVTRPHTFQVVQSGTAVGEFGFLDEHVGDVVLDREVRAASRAD